MQHEHNGLLTSRLKILNISAVGGGCLGQFKDDFALHLPEKCFEGMYLPHIDANSATVITRRYFLTDYCVGFPSEVLEEDPEVL